MGSIGVTELLIILTIVIVLFGVGRIGKIGGELGQAVKNFREGVNSASDEEDVEAEAEQAK
ncbi:MAG: twin-arginine translocase TatA/TatE family subunit [Anaerolineae bacterium]|nr:twin-arginine translocase TatA/TatE family subunit [Anaerolineae bacterium]MDQ7034459.1 twin-arginine translocase TatA/TatE family subunit [Anaerolineae bacterium]